MLKSKSILRLILVMLIGIQVHAMSQEDKVLEIKWAPTEFTALTLDNMISEKYCSYNSRRFLGCLAAVERFGQTTMENTELQLVGSSFQMVENKDLLDLDFRSLQTHRRHKFNELEKKLSPALVNSMINLYVALRKLNPDPKPYQSATAVNEAMAVIFDPHRMYEPLAKYNGLNLIRQNPYVGIAMQVTGNRVGVKAVYFNTAAEKAGVKPGDVILKVNGKDLFVKDAGDLDNVLIFNDQEKVHFTFGRKNRTFEADIIFGYETLAKVVDRVIDLNGKKYAFLQMRVVPSDLDPEPTCRIFSKILKNFEKTTSGMILDLRNNVGGPGQTAACLSALFIDKNKTMYIDQDMSDISGESIEGMIEKSFDKKLVVLVNAKTASSGELITAALKFYARGLILGDRTYGKSIGQVTDAFPGQKYEEYTTVSKAFMPNGVSYQSKGITPDAYVFRDGFEPNEDEKNMLREEDLAIYPLHLEDRKALAQNSAPLVFPTACVDKGIVAQRYNALKDTDWKKDFQLQFALKTLECMK